MGVFGTTLDFPISPVPARVCVVAEWRNDCNDSRVARHDIEVVQHDTTRVRIDAITRSDGSPLNIYAFQSLVWTVSLGRRGPILFQATKSGMIFSSVSRAYFQLSLGIFSRTYYHELRGTNAGGASQTMAAGNLRLANTRIGD